MYMESSGRIKGDVARLLSPVYTGQNAPKCLQFWYHMYGKNTGTLNVYLVSSGAKGKPVWTKTGK